MARAPPKQSDVFLRKKYDHYIMSNEQTSAPGSGELDYLCDVLVRYHR